MFGFRLKAKSEDVATMVRRWYGADTRMVYAWREVGGGIFALRRPRPYSRHCGEIVGGITTLAPHLRPADNNGNGVGGLRRGTPRRYILRRTGESVLNRRTPKGNPPKSPAWVQSFMERAFPPLAMKNVSIKHLQLFEDRSDAACRVVLKPRAHGVCGVA